jgi:hypothetical protein
MARHAMIAEVTEGTSRQTRSTLAWACRTCLRLLVLLKEGRIDHHGRGGFREGDSKRQIQQAPVFRICIILIGLLGAALGASSCSNGDHAGKTETINLGVPPLEQNALLYIADHRRFFENNGLNVVIKDYDTGVRAIQGLLNGEVDIAEAAEFPLVRAIFQKEEIRTQE